MLRFPSVTPSVCFKSAKLSDGVTASALNTPSRTRSFTKRNTSAPPSSRRCPITALNCGFLGLVWPRARRFAPAARSRDLSAMMARDVDAEDDVKAAEGEREQRVLVFLSHAQRDQPG